MPPKRTTRAMSDDSTFSPRPSHKRKRPASPDEDSNRKPKSANLTLAERFLIACLSLIYIKEDRRERDSMGQLISAQDYPAKSYAPKSDISQSSLIDLYFRGLDRTVMSQSKGHPHAFAAPDWSVLEEYLFPWLSQHTSHETPPTRIQIQHVAYRILECLTMRGKVVMFHDPNSGLENKHFGDLPGWWEIVDGKDVPPRFAEWDGSIPGTRSLFEMY